MCQALRQRSIRAITKLTRYIHTFSMDGYFLYFCSLYKNFFYPSLLTFYFFKKRKIKKKKEKRSQN